jgi:phenylpropionate dioxygenase-like ring-hydroxylating dioxygenase large terminal subunit
MLTSDRPGIDYREMVQETPTRFRVRTQVYTDPQIFEAEMRNVFEKSWVYLAHESQVAQPGDFLTSAIGLQPVIITRGQDNVIRVLLNVCRHRGNAVCREDRGNSPTFQCPYHGWVYSNSGDLVGVSERQGYPSEFGDEIPKLGLIQVPRVGTYRGLIFASLSPYGESLDDYLGEVKPYVDLWADLAPAGTFRVSRPHSYGYAGNWKFQAENGADGYHAKYVHQSAFRTLQQFNVDRYGAKGRIQNSAEPGCTRGFDHGHGILERPGLRVGLTAEEFAEYKALLVERHGPVRAEEILNVRHILLFPNVYLMDANIRVIQPVAVDKTVVYSYCTYLDGVADYVNEKRFRDLQRRLGTTGLVGTDDVEMFAANQSGMRARRMEWIVLDRGVDREIVHASGEREGRAADETPQRAMFRGWLRLMTAAAG